MYQIGSHNALTYLKPKKWWMKLLRFTARCQDVDIYHQYLDYNSRCFDFRVRFDNGELVIAHGIIKYEITEYELYKILDWLDKCKDVSIRMIHEVRNNKMYTKDRITLFKEFCSFVERKYPNIKFWSGYNLLPNPTADYEFKYTPSCEEIYSSVCSPKIIDDWYPRWFAKKHNKETLSKGTNKDILLIDFVNYGIH